MTIKEVVRAELINADESDFEAPVRELIYKVLERGGVDDLAKNLVDMATGKEIPMQVKLRALDILGSLFKHSEKIMPPADKMDDMDREEIEAYLNRKLTPGAAGAPTKKTGPLPPKWLQVASEKKTAKKMSSALTLDEAAEMMTSKLKDKKWFVRADPETEPDPAVICFVNNYADVPEAMMSGQGIWGGFPIRLRLVKPDASQANPTNPAGNPGTGTPQKGSSRPVGTTPKAT